MILESIEESPGSRSRPHIEIEDGQDLNFEKLVQQNSPNALMDVDDEEDGLPKIQEATDIIVKRNSDDIATDQNEIGPAEEPASQFKLVAKQ